MKIERRLRNCRKTPAEIAAECWLPASAVESVLAGRVPSRAEAALLAAASHSSPVSQPSALRPQPSRS